MNDLEIIRDIKRELIRKRKEIEDIWKEEDRSRALKAYAELLTSLEIGAFKEPVRTH
ncbi:MAG: hypothetical protein JSV12_04620 [Candidatus Bathyarchaeota archaeon]|nr:MAG: hypothetical protein JSV12_04620 [Candidatus Bathyarchaeota archaeon]